MIKLKEFAAFIRANKTQIAADWRNLFRKQIRAASGYTLANEPFSTDLLDSSPAMVWITDKDSQCVYLSQAWYDFTGRTPERDLGQGWLENIHPDDLAETARVYTKAVADKGTLRVDYRLRSKSGAYFWTVDLGFPRFDENGAFKGYIGTVTDIHERVKIEQQFQETRDRFDRSTKATDLGIWYCDLPFDKLNWNDEVKNHFFLLPDADVDIQLFYARIHPDDREMTRLAIDDAIQSQKAYDIIYRTVNPVDPEDVKSIRALGWTDYDSAGQPKRFDGITLDVTRDVALQKDLIKAKEAADRANVAKSTFLANMSHEIRTPLGAIMGFSELARQEGISAEEARSHLRVVEKNSAQVIRIIDDILDLAKVEAGKVELENIEISFKEFLSDFASFAGFKARETGIKFSLVAETNLPSSIKIDPTRLRQVLTNAVGNAIKFTSEGMVSLHVRFSEGVIEFEIIDTGRGISKEQAEKLFEAFAQADVSTTRKFGGTGLGLVLTKRLCRLMGGDYTLVQSELGQGSRFIASVRPEISREAPAQPIRDFEFQSSQPTGALEPARRLDGVKVLLVEDSPDNQTLVRLFLEKQGAEIEIVSDGLAGLERALTNRFDVVLMDIQMPVMDGHEAVSEMRKRGYDKPVIALTAHAMKEEADRAFRSGFTDFLSKPINRKVLIEKVAAFV